MPARACVAYVACCACSLLGAGRDPAGARGQRRRRRARPPPAKGSPAPAPRTASPVLLDVRCRRTPAVPASRQPPRRAGASLRVSGRNLGAAALLVFYGERGPRDDVTAPASPVDRRARALTTVPAGARSGPVAVIDLAGKRSRRWTGLAGRGPAAGARHRTSPAGRPSPVRGRAVEAAQDLLRRPAEGGLHLPRRSGQQPMDLQVNLVRSPTTPSCRAGSARQSRPERSNRVSWNGARRGPRASAMGEYAFVLSARAARPPRACAPPPPRPATSRSRVYDHMFPVQGAHDFGGGGAHFGAGRVRSLAPGPGRVRRVRHAAGRGPRRQGASSPASTPRPATTS